MLNMPALSASVKNVLSPLVTLVTLATLATRPNHALLGAGLLAVGLITSLAAPLAHAQAWPAKPVKIVVPSAAGSAPDIMARAIGAELQKRLNQTFVIENKPGAGGSIGADQVAKSAPDGYTFVMGNIGSHAMNVATYKALPYNPIGDFAPVVHVSNTASIMSISSNLPMTDVKQFIVYAKEKGEAVTFASGGVGSSSHLAGEYLNLIAGLKMRHVPYKDVPQALLDVGTGRVTMMMSNLPPAMPHIKAGRNKPLAVTTPVRVKAVPDIPTMAEAGVPGFEQIVWFGLFGPKGTPDAIVSKLNAETNAILKDPAFREKLAATGGEPAGGSAKEFGGFVASEIVKWVRVARQAGVQAE
jgi:tripartite-type tricarboxylate transporter receptor subunit TctC